MKHLFIVIVFSLSLVDGIAQSHPGRREVTFRFPRHEALLNIKDSILIGKYFVAVKGTLYDTVAADNPVNGKVFIKGYLDSETIRIKDLKQNFKLLCSDSTKPITNGGICVLKTKNAIQSRCIVVLTQDLTKEMPLVETVEAGDIIVLLMRCFDRSIRETRSLPARWYRVVK